MRKNYKNTLLSLFILMTGALFLVSGISYAFLSYQGIGNKNSNITSSGITFNYKEKSNYISLNEVMPMTDEQGKVQNDYFEFDIASTGVKDEFYIPYDIVLKKTNNSSNIDEAIKVYLTRVENGSEIPIVLTTFNELGNYINQLTNTQNEKLLHNGQVIIDNYNKTFRIRIWVDYDTDFTLSKYSNATFGLSVNVYSKGKIGIKNLSPGLYDDENVLIASWDSLVNDYGLDVETDYEFGEDIDLDPSYINFLNVHMYNKIINDNPALANGTKLVIGNVSKIGKHAFVSNKTLTSIIISSGVESIGQGAFDECTNLAEINLPSSVTSIGEEAFYNCTALQTLEIPSSVTSIGNSVFANCSSLVEINLPSGVESIGNEAFIGCTNLAEINLPSSVTSIGGGAFYKCSALQALEIPSSVTSIGECAFMDCTNLETVTLGENSQLREIGKGAFDNTIWFNNASLNGTPKLNDITVFPYD